MHGSIAQLFTQIRDLNEQKRGKAHLDVNLLLIPANEKPAGISYLSSRWQSNFIL
jgi:hypothetical protein